MLIAIALLRIAMLTFDPQAADHILKRAVERGRIDHRLATIGAGVASPLGLGQAFQAVDVSIGACRRWLVVNVEAKRTCQIVVHRLGDEERRLEAHGTARLVFFKCVPERAGRIASKLER